MTHPMHYGPPGSSVHGILQARILEWVVVPPPGDLLNPGITPTSPALQADALPSEPYENYWHIVCVQQIDRDYAAIALRWH